MSWTVVEFKESMTVEAVPTSWLINNDCYWPPMARDKIVSEIRKNSQPNTCWPIHSVRIFKDATYDDYLVARKKAKKAEDTSDLNSDSNDKRKVITRRISSSSSDDEEPFVSRIPKPPKISIPKNNDLELTNSNAPDKSNNSQKKGNNVYSQPGERADNQSISDCNCCKIHQKKIESFMIEVMRKMTLIRAHLLQISEDMHNMQIREPLQDSPDGEKFLKYFQFPVNSVENLEVDITRYLEDESKFKRAVHDMSKLGGSNTYDFIKRCLTQTITNSLAKEYSYYGAKKKRVFKDLKFNQLLLCASEEHDANIDQKKTEEAIKKWLRRAKERDEKNTNNNN